MNFETSQNGIPQSCFCRHCQNFVRAFGAAPASTSMESPAHGLCVWVHIAHDPTNAVSPPSLPAGRVQGDRGRACTASNALLVERQTDQRLDYKP